MVRSATSTSSRAKSIMALDVSRRTASSGRAIWKPPSRGASQFDAKVWAVLMASTLSSSSTRPEKPSLSRSNASDTTGASRRPASLRVTRRFERTNSGTPSRSSSSRT